MPAPKNNSRPRHFRHSYSLEGEDMILAEYFGAKRGGFFVDVGAHHPKRFSNTYHFYRFRNWRGINIDANPGSMKAFNRSRPEDINLQCAIAEKPGELKFFLFNEPALNTFDPAFAAERDGLNNFKVVKTIPVQTTTLAAVLNEHCGNDTAIDLLTVDVEGLDLQVLRSNDWKRYRPELVLAENVGNTTLAQLGSCAQSKFMARQSYAPIARTLRTTFYRRLDLD